jgi:hypothetical protein
VGAHEGHPKGGFSSMDWNVIIVALLGLLF